MNFKARALAALLIVTITPAMAQSRGSERNLSGTLQAKTWEGTLTNDANSSFRTKMRVSFVQHQHILTGDLYGYDQNTGQYMRIGPIKGSLNGNSAQWSLTTPDGKGTMRISGTFKGNTFSGRHTTSIGSGAAKGNLTLAQHNSAMVKPSNARATITPRLRESAVTTPRNTAPTKHAPQRAEQKTLPSMGPGVSQGAMASKVRTQAQGSPAKASPSPQIARKPATPRAKTAATPKVRPTALSGKQASRTSIARGVSSQRPTAKKVGAHTQSASSKAARSPLATEKSAAWRTTPAATPKRQVAAKVNTTVTSGRQAARTSAPSAVAKPSTMPAEQAMRLHKEMAPLKRRDEEAVRRARASTLRVREALRARTVAGQR